MINDYPKTSREVRESMVGKCISGVVSRPGRNGEPPAVMVLQFDDGSVVEFVSPRGQRALEKTAAAAARRRPVPAPGQMALGMC